MHTIRRIPWLIALSLVMRLMPIDLAAPAEIPSRGASEVRHDTSTDTPHQEQDGSLILLRVRALVPEKITLSDPVQRTVRATVLAIDAESNQIKVQTDEGQRLMLFLDPVSLTRLHVGALCLLQVTNGATRDSSQSPEHEEAFW